ncbi:MAG: carboxymuconolactone decarboxylase family protein [Planctomycetota bacterium]
MSLRQQLEDVLASPGGEPRVRCLALFHGAACCGHAEGLSALIEIAAKLGLPRSQVSEAALQVVAFGGFPRALEALGRLTALWPAEAAAPSTEARGTAVRGAPVHVAPVVSSEQGRPVFRAVYGEDSEAVLAGLAELAPEIPGWVLADAYGRVLARPGLPLVERELLAVSALALMSLPVPLASHARGALRNGSTTASVIDILGASRSLGGPGALAVIDQAIRRLSRTPSPP